MTSGVCGICGLRDGVNRRSLARTRVGSVSQIAYLGVEYPSFLEEKRDFRAGIYLFIRMSLDSFDERLAALLHDRPDAEHSAWRGLLLVAFVDGPQLPSCTPEIPADRKTTRDAYTLQLITYIFHHLYSFTALMSDLPFRTMQFLTRKINTH